MPDQPDLQLISGRLERGEIDSAQYLDQLMRYVATKIGCARAGLRLFVDGEASRTLRSVAMFGAALDRMVAAPDIPVDETGAYFERLQRDGSVTATRQRGDALDAHADYLASGDVSAVMDMGFSVNGVLYGTFSCEQCGTAADWSQHQQQSLRKIASRASLTLMHVITQSVDTAPGALWESSTPNRLATMPMPLDADKPA